MSDVHELVVAVDLRDEISEGELAELRWHLGLGGRPERLSVVTRFPVVVWDDEGEPVIEDDPRPLLAGRGAAARVGGVLCSALESRAGLSRRGWALTSRQEIHPDEFEKVGELLRWLAARAHETHLRGDGAVGVGFLRFHEDEVPEALTVEGGEVVAFGRPE
ncbi:MULTISPECIES: hypothetical protein [unclassified Streptomyces]|uniref:hypothetical protein n=1 Tax=Streptomyces TaxID=1883 RepID=UPI0006AD8E74|nr:MULTISPECIES: hypothetical protein [unclassified Streptomyces]QNE28468.1 hypothetical protein F1D59_29965 [Streptomyces sp. INR7]RST11203.1 hypothetical protein EF904_11580 [Streptomyces sp. WAC05950]